MKLLTSEKAGDGEDGLLNDFLAQEFWDLKPDLALS